MSYKNIAPMMLKNGLIKGYFAVKDYLKGAVTGAVAATNFAYGIAKDAGIEVAKQAVKGAVAAYAPAAGTAANFATEVAAHGVNGVLNGDANVGKCLAKGAFYAATTLAAGPLLAIPVNCAADIALNAAGKIYEHGGVFNAFDAYRTNCERNEEWEILKYRKNFGKSLLQESVDDGFTLMSVPSR